jgi:hypothetical protein
MGNESDDDLRKASTALGRKVKGTNCVLLSALATEKGKVINYVQLISSVDTPIKKSYRLNSTHNPGLFWAKP